QPSNVSTFYKHFGMVVLVRCDGPRIQLNSSKHSKSGLLQAERQPATPCEQVNRGELPSIASDWWRHVKTELIEGGSEIIKLLGEVTATLRGFSLLAGSPFGGGLNEVLVSQSR